MLVGVYGSGYLGTVISACLADFGTPVSCCDTDSTRMVEMAQGNICFFEKNLKEIVKRNVRCGRLSYSTDVEAFSKRAHVIFLAEDLAENLEEVVLRIARHSTHADHLCAGHAGSGWDRCQARTGDQGRKAEGDDRFAADVLHRWMRGGGFQLARPHHSGDDIDRKR